MQAVDVAVIDTVFTRGIQEKAPALSLGSVNGAYADSYRETVVREEKSLPALPGRLKPDPWPTSCRPTGPSDPG